MGQSWERLFVYITIFLVFSGIFGCQQTAKKVEPVILGEAYNENGFDLIVGYHASQNPLIVYVINVISLYDKDGNHVRTSTLQYWEWFKLKNLPLQKPQPMPALQWQHFAPYAGKLFYTTDRLKAGPLIVAQSPPEIFQVIIGRTHFFHLGGKLVNEGQGGQGDIGSFGILAGTQGGTLPGGTAPPENLPPVVYMRDATGQTWDNDWAQRHNAQGSTNGVGELVYKIQIDHTGNWQLDPNTGDFSVE
jgi:hypothetical protein